MYIEIFVTVIVGFSLGIIIYRGLNTYFSHEYKYKNKIINYENSFKNITLSTKDMFNIYSNNNDVTLGCSFVTYNEYNEHKLKYLLDNFTNVIRKEYDISNNNDVTVNFYSTISYHEFGHTKSVFMALSRSEEDSVNQNYFKTSSFVLNKMTQKQFNMMFKFIEKTRPSFLSREENEDKEFVRTIVKEYLETVKEREEEIDNIETAVRLLALSYQRYVINYFSDEVKQSLDSQKEFKKLLFKLK